MTRSHRVWIIYRKELLEILRDRRTLTAMVLIPVVLYPLLMLGFLRAAETEEVRLKSRTFTVEVDTPRTIRELQAAIAAVRAHEEQQQTAQAPAGSQPATARPAETSAPRADFAVRVGNTPPEQLGDGVQLHVAIETVPPPPGSLGFDQFRVRITYNEVNVNSRTAMEQFSRVLDGFHDLVVRGRVQEVLATLERRTPGASFDVDTILDPVHVESNSTATELQRGGWALGQIVPIILVLMTITGSIYPAIDLTAGERERGTLEALMATPVPALQLILGKFLVVATLGMLTALLNVGSVGATMQISGLTRSITQSMPVEIPLGVLPIIIVCMIPFSLLFAAILVAVCSFARTFKEAQSYVMPVILGAMIPAVAVTLPTARLSGIMLVLPVGNMVLLARELFQGSYTFSQVAVVLISTSLYAAAAVGIAVKLFGQEAVVFADSGSYKTLLLRRYYRPSARPTLSQALLIAALFFPASFYAQSLVGVTPETGFVRTMVVLAFVQFLGLFVLVPAVLTIYYRINLVETFSLRPPPARAWLAALMMGVSSWAVAQQFVALQTRLIAPSDALQQAFKQIESQLAAAPLWQVVLLMAVVPAVAEELFFRGFLLAGFSQGMRKWSAIVGVGVTFGIYHFIMDRVPVTAMLGICLAYVCWQTRSIWPGMLMHALHNGLLMTINAVSPETIQRLGVPDAAGGLLPARVFVPAAVLFVLGLLIVWTLPSEERRQPS